MDVSFRRNEFYESLTSFLIWDSWNSSLRDIWDSSLRLRRQIFLPCGEVRRKLVSVNSRMENTKAGILQPRLCWIRQH
jgi:hypothetical protein